MTPEAAAAKLNNSEYGYEGSDALFEEMKAAGLVAVFGYSDDNMEFRGAIHDEVGAYEGATAYLTERGLVENECSDPGCPYYEKIIEDARKIEAVREAEDQPAWTFVTDIPYVTFDVIEEGEVFCRGIVFRLSDAGKDGE